MDNQLAALLKNCEPLAKKYGKMAEYESLSRMLDYCQNNNLALLVCGEYKKGKSSLINALLNENICPVDLGIATSTVSIIKYGKVTKLTRYFSVPCDAGQDCCSIQSEVVGFDSIVTYSKGTTLDIDNTMYLEIELPNDVLSKGLILIDTPGIGSLDPRHLFLTQQALPKADAIFFVTDFPEPLLITELDFIKEKICSSSKPFNVIINKSNLVCKDEVNIHIKDAEAKISKHCGKQVECIPVSAAEWDEYNKTGNERRRLSSNRDVVLAAIDDISIKSQKRQEDLFRQNYLELLSLIKQDIEQAITDVTSDTPNNMRETYREQFDEIKKLRDMIVDDDSDFRSNINAIIEKSQDKVYELFSKESVLLSTDRLDDVLNNPRAMTDNGHKYVLDEINKSIQSLATDVDKTIDEAIAKVIEELKEYIDNVRLTNQSNNTKIEGELTPIMHTFSESFVNLTRQALPFMGVATISGGVAGISLGIGASILGITSVAALPFLAVGIGVVAGVYYVVQSIKGSRKMEMISNIRKQMAPKISIVMNEMRSYIQKRFSLFNKEVVKTLKNMSNSMTEQMQEKINLLKQLDCDDKKRETAKKDLEKQLNAINCLTIQARVLKTNPLELS